jgi:hypothetical protein
LKHGRERKSHHRQNSDNGNNQPDDSNPFVGALGSHIDIDILSNFQILPNRLFSF